MLLSVDTTLSSPSVSTLPHKDCGGFKKKKKKECLCFSNLAVFTVTPQLPHLHYVTSYVCAKMNSGIVKMWQMFGECWCTFVATNSYILIKSTVLWNLCRFGKPAQNVRQCLQWVSVMTPARLTQLASLHFDLVMKPSKFNSDDSLWPTQANKIVSEKIGGFHIINTAIFNAYQQVRCLGWN